MLFESHDSAEFQNKKCGYPGTGVVVAGLLIAFEISEDFHPVVSLVVLSAVFLTTRRVSLGQSFKYYVKRVTDDKPFAQNDFALFLLR